MWIYVAANSTIYIFYRKLYHIVMYIAPSSRHISLNFNMPFKLILRSFEVVSDVWSENAALFERLMEIQSNPPILYTCMA